MCRAVLSAAITWPMSVTSYMYPHFPSKEKLFLTFITKLFPIENMYQDTSQGYKYASGAEYPRVLIMSLVLNVPEFWMYQSSEYAVTEF